MHDFLHCEYEWINGVNSLHAQTLIEAYEGKKIVVAQVMAQAKVNKLAHKCITTSKN